MTRSLKAASSATGGNAYPSGDVDGYTISGLGPGVYRVWVRAGYGLGDSGPWSKSDRVVVASVDSVSGAASDSVAQARSTADPPPVTTLPPPVTTLPPPVDDVASAGYDVASAGYDVASAGYDVASAGYDVASARLRRCLRRLRRCLRRLRRCLRRLRRCLRRLRRCLRRLRRCLRRLRRCLRRLRRCLRRLRRCLRRLRRCLRRYDVAPPVTRLPPPVTRLPPPVFVFDEEADEEDLLVAEPQQAVECGTIEIVDGEARNTSLRVFFDHSGPYGDVHRAVLVVLRRRRRHLAGRGSRCDFSGDPNGCAGRDPLAVPCL